MQAARLIRALPRRDGRTVPILALTANAMKGAREFFLANGFNDFLSKPMDLDKLDRVLGAWVPEDKQLPPRREESARTEPVPPDLAVLPGLDAAKGMAFCGRAEVYRQTLAMFAGQLSDRVRRIRAALEKEREADYILEVHSLKSAARWVGAEDLGSRAEDLEMAARADDWRKVSRETEDLLSRCAALEETLRQVA